MYTIIPAAYIFTHVYLNTMQVGIQSSHCISELFVANNLVNNPKGHEQVMDWATNHKTVKFLCATGGDGFDIARSDTRGMANKYGMAYAEFREPDINNMITSFGFVITPELAFKIEIAQEQIIDVEGMSVEDFRHPSQGHPLALFLSEFRSAK